VAIAGHPQLTEWSDECDNFGLSDKIFPWRCRDQLVFPQSKIQNSKSKMGCGGVVAGSQPARR
jgi:hypothetical protein